VVYTGTHDNPTTREWHEGLPAAERQVLWSYLKRPDGRSSDAAPAMMELAWSSRAALAIVPLQDVLNLGAEARMNMPGRGRRQLALALPRKLIVRTRDRMAARLDEGIQSFWRIAHQARLTKTATAERVSARVIRLRAQIAALSEISRRPAETARYT
jgi:hypothetical protein